MSLQGEFTAKYILNLPRKWYSNEYRIELDILESFIDVSEDEIDFSILKFQGEIKTFESKYGDIVEVYKKVDSQTFDLDSIFKDAFPDLKRKSNFIVIMSDLEINLINFCVNLNKEYNLNANVNFNKNIFQKIQNFFTENLGILFHELINRDWERLKLAYQIRNKIIHNNDKKFDESQLSDYHITDEFNFQKETNKILLSNIHSFLKNFEIALLEK